MVIQSPHAIGERSAAYLTGASSDIARELMSDKELKGQYAFYGTASSRESVEAVAAFMEEEGIAGAVAVRDLGGSGVASWYAEMAEAYGDPSLVIHNAGDPVPGFFEQLSLDDARRAMEVKYYSFVELAHAAGGALASARDRGEPGLLLGVSTLAATAHALPRQSAYGPANAAMDSFAITTAVDRKTVAGMDSSEDSLPWVRVLRLGAVDTKMFRDNAPLPVQAMIEQTGKLLSPAQAAGALKVMINGEDGTPLEPIVAFTGGLAASLNEMFGKAIAQEPEIPR